MLEERPKHSSSDRAGGTSVRSDGSSEQKRVDTPLLPALLSCCLALVLIPDLW